jgi:hypothetical protein
MATGQMTAEDRERYAAVMEEMKGRIDQRYGLLVGNFTYFSVESAALQARLALELLALSSLVTHRDAVAEVASAFERKKPDEALSLVRRLNPSFWPRPTRQLLDEHGVSVGWEDVTDGYLMEVEWGPSWGRLSGWLHARNPYIGLPPTEEGANLTRTVLDRLVCLLNHHQVQLLGRDYLLVCMMHESQSWKSASGRVPADA